MDKTLKRDISAFITKNGPVNFKKTLKKAGLSGRLAQQLVRGTYGHQFHPETEWRIRKALE